MRDINIIHSHTQNEKLKKKIVGGSAGGINFPFFVDYENERNEKKKCAAQKKRRKTVNLGEGYDKNKKVNPTTHSFTHTHTHTHRMRDGRFEK